MLLAGAAGAQNRTWVFFTDKGYRTPATLRQALQEEEARLLPRTRERLAKVRSGDLLSAADLPVFPAYLREIEALTGVVPHAVSRTLNAASFELTPAQEWAVRTLPCIDRTAPVRRFRRDPDPVEASALPGRSLQGTDDYGDSWLQNAVENFPPAHEAGYTGQGVLVGMLDAGWDDLDHVCFASLEIVATWDFVNGDSSVANDPGQMGEGSHGTKTLSCLAGYDEGQLIGTAYGLSVALAKTENTVGENQIEEDNWAAGIEWLDSLGCQVVTSSVSYYAFDNSFQYTYPMRDGNTAVTTIAADAAVARGVVVLNSVGNRGYQGYPGNKMNVPADGDSVLSCGAVNTDSTRAGFASYGPTYDGRIKPDLAALGTPVKVALAGDVYGFSSGTSFSTPITAGACALLLQANPGLTPMEVHAFLKATGTQTANPDTLLGWGIYDVWRAVQEVLAGVAPGDLPAQPARYALHEAHPNPFNPVAAIGYQLSAPGHVLLRVYDTAGRVVATLAEGWKLPGMHEVVFDGSGLGSGVYLVRLETEWGSEIKKAILLK
ncbi:MAG: T9SS C-terminal target domain-containing protein [Candidatus Zixiibacteriota bacterium]|nr:MAG: T9SS C-terminal target domain-containing protein [candidate division Zixibacteria bacterium]